MALERIFFHLLDNAIKFGPAKSTIGISFKRQWNTLHIAVSDQGIGVPVEELRRIFDLFYQVDGALTRQYQGLGLGLAIIKRHLELSGGRVEVSSQPGKGSTFTIIYPIVDG
jgi:signal transduction histidine kinase